MAPSRARVAGILGMLGIGCGGNAPAPVDVSPPRPDVTAPSPAPPSPGASTAPDAPPGEVAAATPTPAPASISALGSQLARGRELYAKDCATCHGANGRGGKSPALVGLERGALPLAPPKSAKYRKQPFKTGADVLDFMVKTMPPTAPGSLGPEDADALLALLMNENGLAWGTEPLDATAAHRLEIARP